jgi:hypothetical protein
MADFTVDPAALQKLVIGLDTCDDELEKGLDALRDIGPKGLGYDFFDDACEHFQDKWDHGLKLIRKSVDNLHGGLKEVAGNYTATEQSAVEGMGGAAK